MYTSFSATQSKWSLIEEQEYGAPSDNDLLDMQTSSSIKLPLDCVAEELVVMSNRSLFVGAPYSCSSIKLHLDCVAEKLEQEYGAPSDNDLLDMTTSSYATQTKLSLIEEQEYGAPRDNDHLDLHTSFSSKLS